MRYNPKRYDHMPLGIILRQMPGVTRWAKWSWQVVAVLPGAGPAEGIEMRREGDAVEYHFDTVELELHGAETEAYLTALADTVPSVYVVLREAEEGRFPYQVLLATVSPYEAQDYTDSGEEIVAKVPMPHGLIAWVAAFVEKHHVEEVFIKRKRDRKRVDLKEEGKGDVRIAQISDVYRAPAPLKPRKAVQYE